MAKKNPFPEAQTPLILNCHRLMEAFAKSNDERDFYLDRIEGFILFTNLDKDDEELIAFEKELIDSHERYCLIPKFSYFETKKIMENFVHEKVYDIDTKEKLTEIIQSKEARENFLEFLFDHHSEFEKWQQFYQERSRVRIIEWLRQNQFHFVFEEDLEISKPLLEKIKESLFETKAGKEIISARKTLEAKAKTYYSSEALNPRPKRGRPPKQQAKLEVEHQTSVDIYTTVAPAARPFLFTPDVNAANALSFSSKFDGEDLGAAPKPLSQKPETDLTLKTLNEKLATLRSFSSRFAQEGGQLNEEGLVHPDALKKGSEKFGFDDDEDEEDEDKDDDSEDEDFDKQKMAKPKVVKKRVTELKPVASKPLPPPVKKKTPPKKVEEAPKKPIQRRLRKTEPKKKA